MMNNSPLNSDQMAEAFGQDVGNDIQGQQQEGRRQFPTLEDLPKLKDADGNELKLKPGKWRKSKLGRKYNGQHND
jgi:hypothetical protein